MPEEAIETTIGVVSVIQIIGREFLNRIQTFPTEIEKSSENEEDNNTYEKLKNYLEAEYGIT